MKPVHGPKWVLAAAGLAWLLVVGLSLLWNHHVAERSLELLAHSELRSSFEKDVVYRQWVTNHGGVYAPITEITPPNPYLDHLPERDLVTPSGRTLTLINPAYMTRQVHELGKALYGLEGHITSLDPIRPANAPDPWEAAALLAFESGVEEVLSAETMNGEPVLRFMRPFIVQPGCLKCHGAQGYEVGDIRGGISVSAPLHRFLDAGRDQRRPLILAHLTIALLGLVGLVLAARLLDRARAREQRAVALQQRLERELDEARRLEAIGRLGGGVAHEFNNHLAVIGTYTELIASELPPGSDLRDDVSQIRKACSEAAALVERLLASGQRSRVERIETDLDQVVARDVATAVATCPDGIRVAHVPSDTPGLVWGDEEKLGEMLRALIANAVEACGGEGTVQIRTTIDTEPGGELSSAASERPPAWGLLVVQDDGCGMTAEVLDRAFEPFFTTKGAASGRGMGLAVVRGLVRQLGGAIGIESSEGRGTMVSVRLPLAQPNHEPSTPRTDRSTSAEPSSATVLLVEDRPELLRVCERVLTRAGYRVLASASGEDALRRFEFEGAKVSLLLTDVSMPGMSGPELATRIRTLAPDLPVLFTSGDASDAGLADQLGEEASYLRKPFDHGRLIAAVEGVLGRRGSASMRIGPRDGEPPGQSKKAAVAPELDPSLLASMEQAALEGDATGLRAFIVERVEPVAPSLAQALSRRVDDYDYDGVLDLIQRCSDIRATGDEDERE